MGVFLNQQGVQTSVNPTATTSSTSVSTSPSTTDSSSTAAVTITATPSSTSTPQPSSGLSTGAKAGIGAGVGGAALVAAVLGVWWYVRRKHRAQTRQPSQADMTHASEKTTRHHVTESQAGGTGKSYHGPVPRHELESPLPSSRTQTDTKGSTTMAEMAG